VEKFQLSSSFTTQTLPEDGTTWSSYKFNKSTKTSSQVELHINKPENDKVSLDLTPDGSQLNITINGTTSLKSLVTLLLEISS